VRTIVLGPPPVELEAFIARRHSLGLDKFDEVWDGEYHMAPMARFSHGLLDTQMAILLEPLATAAGLIGSGAFNLGDSTNFRVPDRGLHRAKSAAVWLPTAAVVIEIESPDDETWDKLDFYAAHGVDEVLVVSAERRSVTWLVLQGERYDQADHSYLLGRASAALVESIDWPDSLPE